LPLDDPLTFCLVKEACVFDLLDDAKSFYTRSCDDPLVFGRVLRRVTVKLPVPP